MPFPKTPALVSFVCALALSSACSKAPTAQSERPDDSAAPAAASGAPQQPNVQMAVGHGADAASPHGVQPAGDASMPASPIAQPSGGSSIADVWANRQSLAGKTVTVRGKVVKFHAGIMNRNWLHLQDGTGQPGDGTHDLAVTTNDMAAVGDVVTATGTVAIDKDFTAGYKYGVIVEQATLKK